MSSTNAFFLKLYHNSSTAAAAAALSFSLSLSTLQALFSDPVALKSAMQNFSCPPARLYRACILFEEGTLSDSESVKRASVAAGKLCAWVRALLGPTMERRVHYLNMKLKQRGGAGHKVVNPVVTSAESTSEATQTEEAVAAVAEGIKSNVRMPKATRGFSRRAGTANEIGSTVLQCFDMFD